MSNSIKYKKIVLKDRIKLLFFSIKKLKPGINRSILNFITIILLSVKFIFIWYILGRVAQW